MGKAKSHPDQIGFAFDEPQLARGAAALAGLEKRINVMVGSILNSEAPVRSRKVIAAQMSDLLGDDDVTEAMLNAYASPARPEHKVPLSRLMALIAVTERHDLLDPIMREIGAALLVGEEIHTARIGHINQQIDKLKTELRQLERQAPLIRGGSKS